MKKDPDDPFVTQAERVAEIAQRAFGDAKDAALAKNERLGIKSYGTARDPEADRMAAEMDAAGVEPGEQIKRLKA